MWQSVMSSPGFGRWAAATRARHRRHRAARVRLQQGARWTATVGGRGLRLGALRARRSTPRRTRASRLFALTVAVVYVAAATPLQMSRALRWHATPLVAATVAATFGPAKGGRGGEHCKRV